MQPGAGADGGRGLRLTGPGEADTGKVVSSASKGPMADIPCARSIKYLIAPRIAGGV